MRIALFEDHAAEQFVPLSWMRPVFELTCGHFSSRERAMRHLPVTEWGAFLRSYLTEFYREQHPEARINDRDWLERGPTLFLNGRWICGADDFRGDFSETAGLLDGTLVAVLVGPDEAVSLNETDLYDGLCRLARLRKRREVGGRLVEHPWQVVDHNSKQIEVDFADRRLSFDARNLPPHVSIQGSVNQVFIDQTAQLDPFVVLDARRGSVTIEAGAVVQPFTRLEGPCYVGAGSQLFRANVRAGTTIGPICRVGGEVEASILHGHVNKYHEGFLGHSYVCPWVNLGALSTNSDLKIDYSNVKFPSGGELIDTGLRKVGCYLGDHAKTGLGSLFNTGSSVGVMSLILPGGELLPRLIPSFTSVWHGALTEGLPIERLLMGARIALERRNCELTPAHERLLRYLFQKTRAEREALTGKRASSSTPSSSFV